MKKNLLSSFALIFAISFMFTSCKDDEGNDSGKDNTDPVASFTITPQTGTVNTIFEFDASSSADIESPLDKLMFRWDFDSDGSWEEDYTTDPTTNHQYAQAGTYTVKLEVKDQSGLTNQTAKNITVEEEGDFSFTTGNAAEINVTSIVMKGDILGLGDHQVSDHGHVWSIYPDPGLQDNKTSLGSTTSTGTFTSTCELLTENMEYYIKAYMISDQGVFFGEEIMVATQSSGNGIPCPGAETVTDADGNVYNTVLINGKCWMKENLNVGSMINSSMAQTDNGTIEKYCFADDEFNCNLFGGLYQWRELMDYATSEQNQGICPDGWHIPTNDEITSLKNFVNEESDALVAMGQSTTSTNGTGFTGLLNGYKSYIPDEFTEFFRYLKIWSTKQHPSGNSSIDFTLDKNNSAFTELTNHQAAVSVRCVKDN